MPAAVSRLNGRYAEVSIGGTMIALSFDWTLTVESDVEESIAHGEFWSLPVALDSRYRVRVRGFVVPASAAHYINTFWASGAPTTTFMLALWSGATTSGTKIWEGTVQPVRSELTAPMALAEQEVEFQGVGAPTTGVSP